MIEQYIWGETDRGEAVVVYEINNRLGAKVRLCNIGAGILGLTVPDSSGRMDDVVLGYRDMASYLTVFRGTMGKTPGRVAGRIAGGRLTVDGVECRLPLNAGENHLHGGPEGFSMRVWEASVEGERVVFTLDSLAGDGGYPGNLHVEVSYLFTDDCELEILAMAHTDAPTVVNLTNHAYFNLSGEASGSALDHELQLNASKYLVTDDGGIPTGEIADVAGTRMDFRSLRAIGEGYDNCWLVDDAAAGELRKVATLADPKSGRRMGVWSNQVGVTVYTGSFLAGLPMGKRREYENFDGVAIECEGLPDAPNHSEFPSIELRPGEKYVNKTVLSFGY